MYNADIRQAAREAGVRLYEIAAEYGVNDGNFSRRLRRELPNDEKHKIFEIINRLATERSNLIAKKSV